MKQVKSLTVVGGGTAGLISALILKVRSSLDVELIYSSNIGIVGVGEGSTEHFSDFMNFVGIKPSEIIKECNATFKIGVMFDNWILNKNYLHSIVRPYSTTLDQYSNVYAKKIIDDSSFLYPKSIFHNLVLEKSVFDIDNNPPVNQYHFDTFKLNDFLIKIAKDKGIKIIEDDIVDIILDDDGSIDKVIGQKNTYKSDFYIDATGFKRILMNKLNVKWISFSKYLKLNSAITFPTLDESNYNYWTLAKAMDAGWRFKIPVWGRHGNGYIYDKNFITPEEAKLEIEKDLGYEIEIKKSFSFDPGALENVWTKNCVAIGLSGSFFEPLEATSIGLTIQQSFLLMHRIQNYDQKVIEEYNKSFLSIINNIRDFIFLHYMGKRKNTDFWKNILKVEVPDSLSYNLEKWKTKIPISEDFKNESSFIMFGPQNFILIMSALNLFNKKAISKEYNFISNNLKNFTNNLIKDIQKNEEIDRVITHKQALEIIRNEKII